MSKRLSEYTSSGNWEPVCLCGHALVAHFGHTHHLGSRPPSFCSQGCGCHSYRASEKMLVTIAAAQEKQGE